MHSDNISKLKSLRKEIIMMAQHTAHVAVALSCVDIIAALYLEVMNTNPKNPKDPNRDRFVLSKGHGCMALYAVLAEAGFINKDVLSSYGEVDSLLAEHPLSSLQCVELATGSLGHGLAVATGMAKALKLQKSKSRVFVLLGDGECDEGSVWEGAAAAASQNLGHLTAIVDANGFQACGKTAEISKSVNLVDCWRAFGWDVKEIDGHDYLAMVDLFNASSFSDKPRVFICHTTKGKGIDFMENDLEWHYRPVIGQDKIESLKRLSDA